MAGSTFMSAAMKMASAAYTFKGRGSRGSKRIDGKTADSSDTF